MKPNKKKEGLTCLENNILTFISVWELILKSPPAENVIGCWVLCKTNKIVFLVSEFSMFIQLVSNSASDTAAV